MKSAFQVLNQKPEFYRFRLCLESPASNEGETKKTVGMAYLMPSQDIYTIRLWMFLNDRYYMIAKKEDPAKFMLFSRELAPSGRSKNKYYWNIVGSAEVDRQSSIMKIQFDLIAPPIYMSLFPEESAIPLSLPDPSWVTEAA